MSGKHDLDRDSYIKILERQIDIERIEHAECLAQKNEEIRQLKRWKDLLKAIYEDLINEEDNTPPCVERRKTPYWTPRKPVWRR